MKMLGRRCSAGEWSGMLAAIFAAVWAVLGAAAPAFGAGGAASTTTLAVTSSGSAVTTVAAGTVVTLTATVTSAGAPVSPGQVKFCDASATYCEDSHLLGIAQLIDGSATLKYVPGVGKHVYEAIFLGTKTVAGSTSNQPIVTVTAAGTPYPSATTVALGSSTMSLQSTVSASGIPAGTPAPTGTVSFLDESNGGAVLATGTLVPGSASVASGTTPVPGAGPFGGATISGDFNGDGYLDLAVSTPGGLNILLNNGAGTFTPVTTGTPLPGAVQMVTGDFNGDGHLDIASLATNTVNPSIAVTVLLGNGDGTFTEAPSPYAATGLGYIVAADFNGDGIEDLAVSSNIADGAGTTTVLLGNGDGSFTLGSQSDVYGQLATGDFNGDGIADLAVYYRNPEGGQIDGGTVYVALGGSSNLTFSPAFNLDTLGLSGQTTSQFIVAADFNGDGMSDLFLGVGGIGTLQDPNAPNCGLALYLATGNGAFNDGTLYPSNAASVACTTGGYNSGVAGDFNGDGSLDVAVTQGDGSAPVQLYAVGAPGFSGTGVSVGTSNAASVPTAGMFDKSGIAGIAVLTAYNPPTDLFLLLPSTSTTVSSVTVNSFSLPEGTTHQVEASYGGDSNYSPSTSPNTVAITGHGIATSLTLTASPAGGATLGEAVTLTAVLSPYSTQSATTNGELVTFQAGNEVVGTGTLNNGTATVTFTPAYPSSSYLSASYGGDKNFASSTASSSGEYRVNPAPTTLSLTASPANLQIGGTLTLTATLNPYTAAGLSTDGEAVTFSSGGMVLGTGKLASGVATLQITLTSIGSASYSAMYAGDANFVASSGNVSYTVNPVPTTLALAVSPLGTTAGQSATLTATLAPYSVTAAGVSSNGEKVTFYTGTTSLGTGTLTNGVATLATTALPAGVDSLTAQYAGDGTLAPSTSAPVSDTVLAIPSITFAVANKTYGVAPFTVAATSTSTGAITYSVVSGPATISGATVTVTGAGTVVLQASQAATSADIAGTQNASFVVAPAQLAIAANSVARVFGVANPAFTGSVTGAVNGDTFTETFSTTATIASSVGSYPITPSVTGTNLADYVVLATPGTLTVSQAGSSTTLALTNGNKTFTATVTSLTSGTPTGTVTFYVGQTSVGQGTVAGGVATYTASSFPVGDVVVSAEYSGDANFTESQSPPILLLGLALGADSLTVGQSGSVTDTVTVSVVPGYTGTVTFSCAGLPANASCSFAPASVAFSGTSASAQVTATISTGVSGQARVEGLGDSPEVWAAGLLAPGLLGLAVARRRRRLRALLLVLVLCGVALGVTACGGSGGGPVLTPQGQATVQVIATGPEGLSQTSSVTLTVQ